MKALNTIQTLCKIGRVLCKIIYICCIVGFIGGAVGIVAMLIGEQAVKIGGVTLHSVLQAEAGIGIGTIWTAIAVSMILCIGEFFVSRMAYQYFRNELETGTPFTAEGARELLHFGISLIWIPIASVVLAQIVQGVISQYFVNVETIDFDGFDSVTPGIMFIFMSLLCKYGAELEENSKNDID